MTMKSLTLSLTLSGAMLAGLGCAQAADVEIHPRMPHVTYGPAIPQYIPVARYVVQQGLPDEGPLTLNDSPYSSAAYPVEYAAPGYAYAPVYGPYYGFGIPFGHRRHSFEHGVGVFRGGHRISAHRPGARVAARRSMPPMMGHPGGHHR
jgi:hypothetical protein